MTFILAALATYWFWETVCAMLPKLREVALLLVPVIAFGALALPLWALAPASIGILVVLAQRIDMFRSRATVRVPKQRRSNIPPLP